MPEVFAWYLKIADENIVSIHLDDTVANAAHPTQRLRCGEIAVCLSVVDDRGSQRGADTRQLKRQRFSIRRIDIDRSCKQAGRTEAEDKQAQQVSASRSHKPSPLWFLDNGREDANRHRGVGQPP